jgi:hypothetical protein
MTRKNDCKENAMLPLKEVCWRWQELRGKNNVETIRFQSRKPQWPLFAICGKKIVSIFVKMKRFRLKHQD